MKDAHAMPRVYKIFKTFAGFKYFRTLDLAIK